MTLINVPSLKELLDLEEIPYDLADSQLELLLTNTIKDLTGKTNIPIQPIHHKTIEKKFDGDIIELDHYPVRQISSLKIGSKNLTDDDFVLDQDLGIIYFHQTFSGMLVVEYCSMASDDVIDNKVNPLVFDIIKYRLSGNFTDNGVMTSVKEGDVQVNYDTSSTLGNLIRDRIEDLKTSYSIRIKVL